MPNFILRTVRKHKPQLIEVGAMLVATIVLTSNISYSSAVLVEGPITLIGQHLSDQVQGITGSVVKLSGNHFPPVRLPRAQSNPVSTRVWIFSGRVAAPIVRKPYTSGSGAISFSLVMSNRWSLVEARKSPNLIGWTMSDSEGRFQVGLKPGEYTLLVEYGTDLYSSGFRDGTSYASLQVEANQILDIKLINSEDATF
jgi:hypothetical protein